MKFIYKLIVTFFTDEFRTATFDHIIGYWETHKAAKRSMFQWINSELRFRTYCYSILKQPLADDLELYSMTEQFLYNAQGKLWSLESGMCERRLHSSKAYNFCLFLFPDQSSFNRAYFKVFDNLHVDQSFRCATLMFQTPEYGICKSPEKTAWFLTPKEKENLCQFLQDKPGCRKGECLTRWQELIMHFNDERGPSLASLPLDLPMPNYELL